MLSCTLKFVLQHLLVIDCKFGSRFYICERKLALLVIVCVFDTVIWMVCQRIILFLEEESLVDLMSHVEECMTVRI